MFYLFVYCHRIMYCWSRPRPAPWMQPEEKWLNTHPDVTSHTDRSSIVQYMSSSNQYVAAIWQSFRCFFLTAVAERVLAGFGFHIPTRIVHLRIDPGRGNASVHFCSNSRGTNLWCEFVAILIHSARHSCSTNS